MTGQEVLEDMVQLKLLRGQVGEMLYWKAYKRLRSSFYRSKEWRALRSEVRKLYKTCVFRTSHKSSLHAHHIRFLHSHPELGLKLSNVILVCKRCHTKIHAGEPLIYWKE